MLRMSLAHITARQVDLRAQRTQVQDLLLRHLVRYHQQQPIALLRRHQRQPQAGVAGSGFDYGARRFGAGADVAIAFRRFDHRQADARRNER